MMTTGGQPRGRRLRGQTKVRRPKATQHSGDDEDGEHDDGEYIRAATVNYDVNEERQELLNGKKKKETKMIK